MPTSSVSYSKSTLRGLVQRLISNKLIDEPTALQAQSEAEHEKIPLALYLAQNKIVDEHQIALTLAQDFGLPMLDLSAYDPTCAPLELVSESLIHQYRVFPLYRRGERLYLATYDPTNQAAQEVIQFHTGLYVYPIITPPLKLEALIEATLSAQETRLLEEIGGKELADWRTHELDLSTDAMSTHESPITKEKTEHDAPVIQYMQKLLLSAIRKHASDIHFEPYENTYRIRFRIDGILYEVANPPLQLAPRLTARLKVMANLDISERRRPQDGRFKLPLSKKRNIDFRISTCPTLSGEKVVLRLLENTHRLLDLDSLGFSPVQRNLFLKATQQPHGMILVTGPTGSGKTVTLYTALNLLNSPKKNISTVEDPVEIRIPGINQVNVNPKAGLHFAEILRAFLRQDPDILMVGEMRDTETVEIGIKAAQTGHLVLSTLHTNSAVEALNRLRYMGVEPFNIVSSVILIIAQRLARCLCKKCKKEESIPEEILLKEGFTQAELPHLKLYTPVGCSECTDGYQGRTGIFEMMPITPAIHSLILQQANILEIEAAARNEGMSTLRESGLEKVGKGITSLAEIIRITRK